MDNKIIDFLLDQNKYTERELLNEYLGHHNKYGTLDYAVDDRGNIVAVCRWNMSSDGTVAEILDFAIASGWRRKGIGKDFILRALDRFPNMERLEFKRGVRGDERVRTIDIKGILKRDIF